MTPPTDTEAMLTRSAPQVTDVTLTARTYTPSVGFSILLSLAALNFLRIGCQLVVIAWSAVQVTGRAESVGLILLVSSITNLALSPFIGVFIDRCSTKKPLVLAGHAGIAFCGTVPHLVNLFLLTPLFGLAVAALLSSVFSVVIGGAMDYFMKLSIEPGERIKKLAMINSASQLTLIVGTAIGGYIVSCVSWRDALLSVTACGLVLTVVCAFLLPPLRLAGADTTHWRGGVFTVGPGLYVKHHLLFSIACCSALAFSIGQVTNTLLPGLMSLYLGFTGRSYSLVEAAWSVGALAASVGLAKIGKAKGGELHHDFLVILAVAGLLAIVPRLAWLPALLAAHLLLGVGFLFVRVRSETRFLTECPTHLLGRFRANSLFLTSSVGVIIFVTPTVCKDFPIPRLYQLLSAAIAVSSIVLLRLTKRRPNT